MTFKKSDRPFHFTDESSEYSRQSDLSELQYLKTLG